MSKEQWFRNFERALAEREGAGFKPKAAYELAAKDADDITVDQWATAADMLRLRQKMEGGQ
jgi:hypothetical protein